MEINCGVSLPANLQHIRLVKERLSPAFGLVRQTNEPLLIRKTARTFQFTFSLATVWRQE